MTIVCLLNDTCFIHFHQTSSTSHTMVLVIFSPSLLSYCMVTQLNLVTAVDEVTNCLATVAKNVRNTVKGIQTKVEQQLHCSSECLEKGLVYVQEIPYKSKLNRFQKGQNVQQVNVKPGKIYEFHPCSCLLEMHVEES